MDDVVDLRAAPLFMKGESEQWGDLPEESRHSVKSVSYTHLTLPTILLV